MKGVVLIMGCVFALCLARISLADNSTSHTIRIIIIQNNEIGVSYPQNSLKSTHSESNMLMSVDKDSRHNLWWRNTSTGKRITVSSKSICSDLSIYLEATSDFGDSVLIPVSQTDREFMDITSRNYGTCSLKYIPVFNLGAERTKRMGQIFYTITDTF